MSQSPHMSSEIASNDLDSVVINPPKITKKWNRMVCILLSFPNYTLWNAVVLISVLVNFYFVTTCFCFLPHYLLESRVAPLFGVVDFIYLFNFILLSLHRFWKRIERNLTETVKTPNFFLLLDLITILSQAVILVQFSYTKQIFLYCRLATSLRLHNLLFFKRKQRQLQESRWKWFLIQSIINFFVMVHAANLILYLIASNTASHGEQLFWKGNGGSETRKLNELSHWYFMTTYAVIQLILNVGFGDFFPLNYHEVFWFAAVLLVGQLVYHFFLSELCWLMINNKFHKTMYSQKVTYVNKYIENVTKPTRSYVKEFYENLWDKQNGINNVSVSYLLPSSITMDITYDLNCGLLHRSVLLKNLPVYVKRRISLAMKNVFLLPGEAIYYKYVVKKQMVCIEEGVLEVLYDDDDHTPIILFRDGTVFGEIALFLNVPAKATVQAAKYTELKVLEKGDFIKIMTDYPDELLRLRRSVEKRINITLKDNSLKNVESQNLKRLKLHLYDNIRQNTDAHSVTGYKKEYLTLYKVAGDAHVIQKSFICLKNNFPWILQENSSLLKIWRLLISVTQIILCLLYPYYAVFERGIPHYFYIYGILADVSCFADIIIQCTTSVHFKDKIVTKIPEIVDHRLNSWKFYCDVFSLFPVEVWAYLVENQIERDRMYDLLKLNRMLRLWRITSLFRLCDHKIKQTSYVLWIVKSITYMFIFTYYTSCIFYLNACLYEICEEDSWFYQEFVKDSKGNTYFEHTLLTSVYFTIMSSFHTGLGDILPKSNRDIILVTCTICLALLLKNYCIGQLVSSAFLTGFCKQKQEILSSLNRVMEYFRIQEFIKLRIKQFLLIGSYFTDMYGKKIIQRTASNVLDAELHTSKIQNTLSQIPLFSMADTYFIAIMEKESKIFKLPLREMLYYYGDPTRQMFVLQKGICELYNAENVLIQTLGPGNQFGMIEMILGVPKKHTVIALTDCVLISVEYSSFLKTIKTFPKEYDAVNNIVKNPSFVQIARDINFEQDCMDVDYTKIEQKSFISSCKNWSEYWQTYGRRLGFFWFLGLLLVPVTINPEGTFLKAWCTIRCILIAISGLVLPLVIMTPPLFDQLYWVYFVCQASLYLDMYILFHVAYYDKRGIFKTHPIYTAWYYITHSFLIDLMSALPVESIFLYFNPLHSGGHSITTHMLAPHQRHCKWKLMSLIQFHRIFKWFDFFENDIWKPNKILKIVKCSVTIILLINLLVILKLGVTCSYEFDAKFQDEPATEVFYGSVNDTEYYGKLICRDGYWSKHAVFHETISAVSEYFLSIYSVTNFITNTGLKNITMETMSTVVIFIATGFVSFAILTATISAMFLQTDLVTIDYRNGVASLMGFLEQKKMSKRLKRHVYNHFSFIWINSQGLDYLGMLQGLDLNTALTQDVILSKYHDFLKYSALYNELDVNALRLMMNIMKLSYFKKGETIVRYKDIISDIYIIMSGQVDILNEEKAYITTIGKGGIFGNIRHSSHGCSVISVIARKNVNLCVMSSEKFVNVIRYHPQTLIKMETSLFHESSYIIPNNFESDSEKEEGETESDEEPPSKQKSSPSREKLNILQLCIPCRWFQFAIKPDQSIFTVIDFLTFIASFINMYTIPFIFATQIRMNLCYLELSLEPVFYVRVFLKLHEGYSNSYGNYVTSNRKITQRYFNNPVRVVCDILPNLPICLVCFMFPRREWFFFYTCLRLLHLLRFYYILTYFNMRDGLLKQNSLSLVLKLITIYCILIHLLSCCWFMLACPFGNCNPQTWIFKTNRGRPTNPTIFGILLSYYYVISTITTTGIGDIWPKNLSEIILTITVMMIGKIMSVVLIGGILRSIYLSNIDLVRFEYRAKILKTYLANQHISDYQMRKVWQYLQKLWNYEKGNSSPKLLHSMPYVLTCDVMTSLYGHHLRESFLFRNIDESLLRQICSKLVPVVFFQDDYVVKYGDANSCMYFIHEGNVSVLTKHTDLTETQHVILHPNDMFGVSQGVNQETVHHFTYRAASSAVEILVLRYDSWSFLLSYFPADERLIVMRVQKSYTKM